MTDLMTARQVAKKLGVHPKTIYKWTHAEMIPHVKMGKAVRFLPEDVEEFVLKHRVKGRATRLKPVY